MEIKNVRIVYDFDEYMKEVIITDEFKLINKDFLPNRKVLRKVEKDIDVKMYRRISRLINDVLLEDHQYELSDFLFELYINENLKDELIFSGSMDEIPYEIYEELDKLIKLDIKG